MVSYCKTFFFGIAVIGLVCLCFWCPVFASTSSELTARKTETDTGYRVDYVDSEGNVVVAENLGYASVVYEVSDGKCFREWYLDAAGSPVAIWGGQYGFCREAFDSSGRCTRFSYIDLSGNPWMVNGSYSTVERSYDEEGRVYRDFYFDSLGAPVSLGNEEYGIEYIWDSDKRHAGSVLLATDGSVITNSLGYSIVKYGYDSENRLVSYSYFDASGNPVSLSRGQHTMVNEYSGSKVVRTYYLDIDGNEIFMLDLFLHQYVWINFVIALVVVVLACLFPPKVRYALLVSYVLFILYMTLYTRESHDTGMNLDLIKTYSLFFTFDESRREILNNVAFFIPLGGILYSIWPRKFVLLIPVGFSLVVETVQLITGFGWFELSDIVDNGLGGLIGIGIAYVILRLKSATPNWNIEKENKYGI